MQAAQVAANQSTEADSIPLLDRVGINDTHYEAKADDVSATSESQKTHKHAYLP